MKTNYLTSWRLLDEATFSGGDVAIITIAAVLLTLILLGLLVWWLSRRAQKLIDSGEIKVEDDGKTIILPLSERKQTDFTKERLIAIELITDTLATGFCGLSEDNIKHDMEEDEKGNKKDYNYRYLTITEPTNNVSQAFIKCGDNAMKVLTWFNAMIEVKIMPTRFYNHLQMEITYRDEGAGQLIKPFEKTKIFIVKSSKIKAKVLKWLVVITEKRKNCLIDSANFKRAVCLADVSTFEQCIAEADDLWKEVKDKCERLTSPFLDHAIEDSELAASTFVAAIDNLVQLQVLLARESGDKQYNERILDSLGYLVTYAARVHPEYLPMLRSTILREAGVKEKDAATTKDKEDKDAN